MNKKVSTSRERLVELMDYYNLSQTELCKKTGLQKSALSNYLNGDREPRQNQLSLIADPFNINPAWLMGYDVPMFMPHPIDTEETKAIRDLYTNVDAEILEAAENDPQLKEFIQLFLHTAPDDRPAVLQILKGLQRNS